ncbi:MAG: hypothetical protein AAF573_21470, partial [Bacteroidota bacterium]
FTLKTTVIKVMTTIINPKRAMPTPSILPFFKFIQLFSVGHLPLCQRHCPAEVAPSPLPFENNSAFFR